MSNEIHQIIFWAMLVLLRLTWALVYVNGLGSNFLLTLQLSAFLGIPNMIIIDRYFNF